MRLSVHWDGQERRPPPSAFPGKKAKWEGWSQEGLVMEVGPAPLHPHLRSGRDRPLHSFPFQTERI